MFTSTPFPQAQEGTSASTSVVGIGVRQSMSRSRQSYAFPLQQVFEETRSMLLDRRSMEPSVFEQTLQSKPRNRLTLPASGADDFIGAMESLHGSFGLTIQAMTSRSEVFEVVSEWIADIDLALQHQKNSETDLSDSDTHMLQNLLRKEQETWNLIKLLYYERLYDDGTHVEPFDEPIYDKFCINEEPYVRAIVAADQGLRELYVTLNWLETNYIKHGPPDLNEKFFIWEHTLESLKRDKLVSKPTSSSMVSHVDPDAPTREGKQLHPLDDEENTKVLRGAYYYIRTGYVDNAISYLLKSGDRVKAAALSGYQYTCMVQPDLETGEAQEASHHASVPAMEYLPKSKRQARPQPDFEIEGNPKRELWKRITYKVCEKNGVSKYDRALLGALCGHRQSMLDVSQTWEDRLWAFIKATTDVTVEGTLRNKSVPNTRKALPDSYWVQKLSMAECIEKVDAMSQPELAHSPDYFFQLLQKCVMTDNLEQFLESLDAAIPDLLETYNNPLLNSHLTRFFSHLLLFFGIVELPHSQRLMDICMENYIGVLVDIQHLKLIPYYVQKLTDERKIPTIVRHIKTTELLTSSEIESFLWSCHKNELDVLGIGVAVVDKMRDEEEDFSPENLDWIRCCTSIVENSAGVMYELLKYTIWISRKYLTLGNIQKVQQLVDQLTPANISELSELTETLENTLVREYVCYKVYLAAEEAFSLWKTAMSQRPVIDDSELPTSSTLADRTVFEKKKRENEAVELKWRRAVDFHLNNAIEKFIDILKFPLGWLRECYDPMDEDETIHVGAVRRIIIRTVVHILLRLVQDKNDTRTIRDFVYVICDDKRNILPELSPAEIANVFKVVEQYTRKKVDNIMFLPK